MSKKSFRIIISILAVVIITIFGMNIAEDQKKTWDSEHPMANARISWEQTYHSGAWSE